MNKIPLIPVKSLFEIHKQGYSWDILLLSDRDELSSAKSYPRAEL